MPTFEQIIYEVAESGIVRVVLNRAEARNAQDTRMLYELNDALDLAAQDDDVKVIVIAANGPHFSAGHYLREKDSIETQQSFKTFTTLGGFERGSGGPVWQGAGALPWFL